MARLIYGGYPDEFSENSVKNFIAGHLIAIAVLGDRFKTVTGYRKQLRFLARSEHTIRTYRAGNTAQRAAAGSRTRLAIVFPFPRDLYPR